MAYSKPYVLMPIVVVARDQHHSLVYNPERGELRPEQLAGKRVGVRAYTVTTGVWVRGILHEQFGLDLNKVDWVTFDDSHLGEYTDPPEIQRAPSGKDIVQMLLDGEIDAAVVGDKLPNPRLRRLIPDHEGAAAAWSAKHGNPINHMLVVRRELSHARPDIVGEFFRVFKESRDIAIRRGNNELERLQFGLEANRRSLETIIRIAFEQKIIPEKYAVEDLFDEVTAELC
jgi:4,5-dihydroxyphthalate decarboxylase